MKQILLFLFLLPGYLAAQSTDQIIQNGGFEGGNGYPTKADQLSTSTPHQLEDKCYQWKGNGNLTTPDWYTTQNLPDALHGGCPFEYGSAYDAANAQPVVSTHDGSSFYAGFGTSEYMRNILSRETYSHSRVKVSFWYCPRGQTCDTRINVMLVDNNHPSSNTVICYVEVVVTGNNPTHNPCTWYYYESPWISTGAHQFDEIQIGGGSPNPAGAYSERGYIYLDDANLYNGLDCCPREMLYEDNDQLANETNVYDFISAGFDIGIPNVSGDVTIHNGQHVIFQAGNDIHLADGFNVERDADFSAFIDDCNPFTQSTGTNISVQTLPNVMTPNGDNVNDELCFNVTGAQYYRIEIFSRWGTNNETLEYSYFSSFTSNIVCTWDGGNFEDGTYFYIVTFSNCESSSEHASFFSLIRNNERLASPADTASFDSQPMARNSISIFPNPTMDGNVIVELGNQSCTQIEIYNNIGQLIHPQKELIIDKNQISLQGLEAGIYYLRILFDNGESQVKQLIVL